MPVECEVKLSKYNEGENVNPIFFKSLIESLHYLTLFDMYKVKHPLCYWTLSSYMKNPKTTQFKATKRILSYIKGTIYFGLLYSFSIDYKLIGYNNSD